ncbi:MAG: hypothetical protein WBB23_21725 [Desulforhopalus sp.]
MPTVRIDDEVYSWLQNLAQPFEDTPNSVLRRIAKLEDKTQTNNKKNAVTIRTIKGDRKTPQYAFRVPILGILKKMGGRGNRQLVLKELEKIMEKKLTDYDKTDISSGSVRWQKSAEWEVRVMREQKLLKQVSETPRGVWALTEEGYNLIDKQD